jgi:hypothetical protein
VDALVHRPIIHEKDPTMRRTSYVLLGVLLVLIAAAPGAAQQKDAANCKDHPLLTRIPDYWIQACTLKQFDGYAFSIGKGKTVQVEGQFTNIRYQPPASLTTKPSTLQLLRNVENAVKQIGGTVVATDESKETLKLTKDGKELWIEVWADYTGKYILTIVEKAGMAQDIVGNAGVFANDLKRTGHVAVEGIYFETGKSELKPESAQAIAEVAKLLKEDAGLKLYVVGHTDNAGALEGNMRLSQDRAQSVVQALVRTHGLELRASGPMATVPMRPWPRTTQRKDGRRTVASSS